MTNIIIIIGSPRGKKSNSVNAVKQLFCEVDKYTTDYMLDVVYLSERIINECCGCLSCFKICKICPRFHDDVHDIEKKMLGADLIIWVSPVYAHNVTGIMKNFIDRISYGLHIFRFIGKFGYVISISASNGNSFVNDYLGKILLYFGVKVIDKLSIQTFRGLSEDVLNKHAKQIAGFICGNGYRRTNDFEEKYYIAMKPALQEVIKRTETNETRFWSENDYFNYSSFEELFRIKCTHCSSTSLL